MVSEMFNMFDQDGSGEIELEEIAKAFETMGKLTKETREQLKAHFEFMDRDGSGTCRHGLCIYSLVVFRICAVARVLASLANKKPS